MAEWDNEIDELYTLDPGAFVAARNALAKLMKAEGDKEAGAAVAKLARPTVVAWALNQAVRADGPAIGELIDATERVATAQSDLMAGGDAAELRAATAARRSAAAALVRSAVALAGPNHSDTLRNTLDAALADPELTGRLRSGTLSETLDAPAGFGFGIGSGTPSVVDELAPRRKARDARRATRGSKAATIDEPASPKPDESSREATADAKALVDRLHQELTVATNAVAEAAEAVDAAAGDLTEAETALTLAQQRFDHAAEDCADAADALAASRAEQERLAELLSHARELLDQLR